MWASRIIHEASLHEENCFITLTYNDEHLPADGSLDKKHYQKFMKRLRKRFPDRSIRYYMCGEYGDEDNRPHYHACLFNIEFHDKYPVGYSDAADEVLYSSPTLEQLWPFGFVVIGSLDWSSAAYVARYCLKKVNGKQADDHYLRCDEYGVAYWIEPEYNTMSRRPGIAKDWYEKYKNDIFPSDEVPVPGRGVFKKVPRYYEEQLRSSDPEQLEEIKRLRKVFRDSHVDEYSSQRLMQKYNVQKAKMKSLTRS